MFGRQKIFYYELYILAQKSNLVLYTYEMYEKNPSIVYAYGNVMPRGTILFFDLSNRNVYKRLLYSDIKVK